jgi:hypothetical protein
MIISVFDNGGVTPDRYTVIINNKYAYAMSDDALSPNGINRYLCHKVDLNWENLGEPSSVRDLPEAVRKAIEKRCDEMV